MITCSPVHVLSTSCSQPHCSRAWSAPCKHGLAAVCSTMCRDGTRILTSTGTQSHSCLASRGPVHHATDAKAAEAAQKFAVSAQHEPRIILLSAEGVHRPQGVPRLHTAALVSAA